MKGITIGQYYACDSLIHRLDPRVKIVLALAMIVIVFFVTNYWGYALLYGFTLAIAFASRVPFKVVLRTLKPLIYILIFTFLLNILFYTGPTVLWEFWIIKITAEGLSQAVFMALRLMLLVVATSLLTLTTSPIELTDGIERLLRPLTVIKFPAHEVAMMMTIALRFIPTLSEEADKIMKAQASRGADFESGNLVRRAKNLLPLLVPLFVSAFRRADELALAMEARGYRGGTGRTRMRVLHLEAKDYISLAAFIALAAVIIWLG